jgi:predicted nucleic acid-binding protein
MIKLDDALMGVRRLGFDTSPLIYFVEANPQYDALVTEIFRRVSNGAPLGVTSVITLSEVLVQPIIRQHTLLQREYRDLLLRSGNFNTLAISATIAELGAELRAQYRLRTPDALQIATALEAGCEAFLSNDSGLRRVTELRVLILDDLEL